MSSIPLPYVTKRRREKQALAGVKALPLINDLLAADTKRRKAYFKNRKLQRMPKWKQLAAAVGGDHRRQ